MVRIVNKQPRNKKLPQQAEITLHMLGLFIAKNPNLIKKLLSDYGVKISTKPGAKELSDKIIKAIGDGNNQFNKDLTKLIIEELVKSDHYSNFDFKSLLSGKGGAENGDDSGRKAGGGIFSNVLGAVGKLTNLIGKGKDRKLAEQQMRSQTMQGMLAYKAQQDALAAQKGKGKDKGNQNLIIIAVVAVILIALGIVIVPKIMKPKPQPLPNPTT